MTNRNLVDKKCGTLRVSCVTSKPNVPQSNKNKYLELERLRDIAGHFLYPLHVRTRTRACVRAVNKKVTQRHAEGNNSLNDSEITCGTYPFGGPAKVPQNGVEGPASREWAI